MALASDAPFAEAELRGRVAQLQRALAERQVDAALIGHPVDLYYYAGTTQQCWLWVPSGEGTAPTLLVRRVLERAGAECPFAVEPMTSFSSVSLPQGLTIGMELDVLPVQYERKVRSALAPRDIVDVSDLVRTQRSVKSATELRYLRGAAAQTVAALQAAKEALHAGIAERDIAIVVESALRRAGHLGPVRFRGWDVLVHFGHLGSGAGTAQGTCLDSANGGWGSHVAVPYGPGLRTIGVGEPLLIDYAGNCAGYVSDCARVLVVGGLPPPLAEAHDACLQVYAELRMMLRPGLVVGDLYRRAHTLAEELGIAAGFMGIGGEKVRFLGHGIGLEVDELPVLMDAPTQLVAGNVVALEPKCTLRGLGTVGTEDSFVITAEGAQPLTTLPNTPWVVPA